MTGQFFPEHMQKRLVVISRPFNEELSGLKFRFGVPEYLVFLKTHLFPTLKVPPVNDCF